MKKTPGKITSTILHDGKGLVGPKRPGLMPIKTIGPFQVPFRFSATNILIYFKGQPNLNKEILEYREQIISACRNKKGDMHFLQKGLDENHSRLLEKDKKVTNCSHMGMLCMKDCPKVKETERPVFKDGKLSNVMVLLNGQVLYGVTNTRKKSMYKYERELAKLMVPTRLSPSGPVKGTKSAQPPSMKKFQQRSTKPICRRSKKSRNFKKIKTKSKKTEFVTSFIPNPVYLLAAYSKNKKKVEFMTTPNIPTASSPTKSADPATAQRPTMPLFSTPLRKGSGWKYFGPGLHGGAPPKACHGKKILQESGQQEVKEEPSQEALPSKVQTEASMDTAETYGRTEGRPDTKASHVFKGIFALIVTTLT